MAKKIKNQLPSRALRIRSVTFTTDNAEFASEAERTISIIGSIVRCAGDRDNYIIVASVPACRLDSLAIALGIIANRFGDSAKNNATFSIGERKRIG